MYLNRMEQCGIGFGELPVSSFFWRAVADMQEPVDFVSRLSLTFEQANLDYCRHFADGFKECGDTATAGLLDQIYRDEIGHVAHGLKWFRKWKRSGETDWDAFCRQLKFPLSPARAKGIQFNSEGRREAGLQDEFIDELSVYSRSRGRTPIVYVFNPFADIFIAQGSGFHPVKAQLKLVRDLENVVQFLAGRDDVVLVEERPSVKHLRYLQASGFPLPEFVRLKEGVIEPGCELLERKLGGVRPWAWSPDSIELLRPLLANVSGSVPREEFTDELAQLYSKGWAARYLDRVLQENETIDFLCGREQVGQEATSIEAALDVIEAIRGRGHHNVVVKELHGTAGHNMIRLWEPDLQDSHRKWLERTIDKRGGVLIEPWLDRVVDFSVQFEMREDGLHLVGFARVMNDLGGQFHACWAGPQFQRKLPEEPDLLFKGEKRRRPEFYDFYRSLLPGLEQQLRSIGYVGPLGFDALIYREKDDLYRLKPIVEINPRVTLGRLTLELMRRARPGRHGVFRLMNRSMIQKEGYGTFPDYAHHLGATSPLSVEGDPVSAIESGTVCLNDPDQVGAYLATFQVGPGTDAQALSEQLAPGLNR